MCRMGQRRSERGWCARDAVVISNQAVATRNGVRPVERQVRMAASPGTRRCAATPALTADCSVRGRLSGAERARTGSKTVLALAPSAPRGRAVERGIQTAISNFESTAGRCSNTATCGSRLTGRSRRTSTSTTSTGTRRTTALRTSLQPTREVIATVIGWSTRTPKRFSNSKHAFASLSGWQETKLYPRPVRAQGKEMFEMVPNQRFERHSESVDSALPTS